MYIGMRLEEPQPMTARDVPCGRAEGEGMEEVRERRYSWQFYVLDVSSHVVELKFYIIQMRRWKSGMTGSNSRHKRNAARK